jgi:hypothetical protein
MTRPRCEQCRKPSALRATMNGKLCKRCCAALPPHLLRDPTASRPNADSSHRTTKRAGTGTTRPQPPTPTPKQPRNQPCPCGSGHKVRHCHGRTPEALDAFLARRSTQPVQG